MAALRFIDAPGELELATTVEGTPLALAVAAVALVIGGLVIAINVGLLYRQMFLQMHRSESRLRAIADTAVDGTVVIDAQGRVQSFNAAAETHPGLAPQDVVGQNVSIVPDAPSPPLRHDTDIQRYLQGQGGGLIGGDGREVLALRPDGSTVPPSAFPLAACRSRTAIRCLWASSTTSPSAAPWSRSCRPASSACAAPLMASIPGVTFRLPLRRRLHHAVHQRCGDRTDWLNAGLSGRPCQFSPSSRCPEEVGRLLGGVSTAIQEQTAPTSWGWPAGPRRALALGAVGSGRPWWATTARCCRLTASSWT